VLANDKSRLVGIFGKARLGGEETVFAPPIEDQIGSLVGEWTMQNFVAAVNAVDNRLAVTRILQFGQLRDDVIDQRVIVCQFDDALRLMPLRLI